MNATSLIITVSERLDSASRDALALALQECADRHWDAATRIRERNKLYADGKNASMKDSERYHRNRYREYRELHKELDLRYTRT